MILVSYENAHQKVTSGEEKFNNEVDQMTRCVEIHPFSPVIPVIVHWPTNKMAMEAEMDIIIGCHSLSLTWVQLLLGARSAKSIDQH